MYVPSVSSSQPHKDIIRRDLYTKTHWIPKQWHKGYCRIMKKSSQHAISYPTLEAEDKERTITRIQFMMGREQGASFSLLPQPRSSHYCSKDDKEIAEAALILDACSIRGCGRRRAQRYQNVSLKSCKINNMSSEGAGGRPRPRRLRGLWMFISKHC